MRKILILFLIFICSTFQAAYAEKTPVRITPTQVISTHHDELETGDYIAFEIVNDVFVNDKLYIKKNTPIIAFVDFFHQNGWSGDSAEIRINSFYTHNTSGDKISIKYPLIINGNSLKSNDIKFYISRIFYILFLVRGSEIYLEPDTKVFNIFIEN